MAYPLRRPSRNVRSALELAGGRTRIGLLRGFGKIGTAPIDLWCQRCSAHIVTTPAHLDQAARRHPAHDQSTDEDQSDSPLILYVANLGEVVYQLDDAVVRSFVRRDRLARRVSGARVQASTTPTAWSCATSDALYVRWPGEDWDAEPFRKARAEVEEYFRAHGSAAVLEATATRL